MLSWRCAGKGGVGKSSTVNSLLGERVANVAALQSDVARPQVISRAADGFTLTLIDTPGLLEADAVSDAVRPLQPALLCVAAGLVRTRMVQEPALLPSQACALGLFSAAALPLIFTVFACTVATSGVPRWPREASAGRTG